MTPKQWAKQIAGAWRDSLAGILKAGALLVAAKEALEHGKFQAMIESDLPFSSRTARRLMAVARDPRLSKRTHVSVLPLSWGTLYELTKLTDDEFKAAIDDGTINPEAQRSDIVQKRKATARIEREQELATEQLALPDKRYGVILADPEWRFEPYSRMTGMDRAADNHYPTSVTEAIAARDVPSIAADDCALFLWATAPMLPQALLIMAAWGFNYRSQIVWLKDRIGTGYWFRNKHELLLLGVRGEIPAPIMGTQWPSVIEAPVGEHSAKPEIFADMIEHYFPSLPKIELNRRGGARIGWDAWGNETVSARAVFQSVDASSLGEMDGSTPPLTTT